MSKVKITQKKSLIGYPEKQQRKTMAALGFGRMGKINKTLEKDLTPAIQGMINKVAHLVTVEII
jgi:large subunit ribosomal protein L30